MTDEQLHCPVAIKQVANYKFVILLDAKTKVTKLFRNQGPEAAVKGPRVS